MTGIEREALEKSITPDQVVIGRTDDSMIFVVMPPIVLATSFMLLSGNHLSVNCQLLNAMAAHMKNDDVMGSGIVTEPIVNAVLTSLAKRHKVEEFAPTIVLEGTSEMFEGMYYATIHPTELAGVGQVMREIRSALPTELSGIPVIKSVVDMWFNASQRLVQDNEVLALMGNEGVA
jgi:hypothetical protein